MSENNDVGDDSAGSLTDLQEAGTLPDGGLLDFIPTAAGLISIPLIILPLDILAHFSMNKTFRKAATALK